MSHSAARAAGWERVDGGRSKCNARWLHRSGWRAEHCGHPTALHPWLVFDPAGELHLHGATVGPKFDRKLGFCFDTLAEVFTYVAEQLRRAGR